MNTLADPLFDIAARAPERTAIVHRGRSVSYGELARRVRARAAELRRRGIGEGDRVLVFVPMSIPLYEILLAVFAVGAAAVFVDAWAGARRIDRAAALAECKGFVGVPKAFLLLLASRALRRIPVKLLPSFGAKAREEAGTEPGHQDWRLRRGRKDRGRCRRGRTWRGRGRVVENAPILADFARARKRACALPYARRMRCRMRCRLRAVCAAVCAQCAQPCARRVRSCMRAVCAAVCAPCARIRADPVWD